MRYEFADCVLDVDRHVLLRSGETVPIEPQVFDLLELLAESPGKLVVRDEIIERVWNGRFVSDSTISARIAAARRAVGDDGKSQRIIRTIVRRGLQMAVEVSCENTLTPREHRKTQHLKYAQGTNGQAIAYTKSGEGPPVVRVGSIAYDLEAEWRLPSERAYINAMEEKFTLLRYNKRHQTNWGDPRHVDYDGVTEDILAVSQTAGFDRFAIVAEFGGLFSALRFAVKYPERVSRLVIVGGWAEGRNHRDGVEGPDSIRNLIVEGWQDPGSGYAVGSLLSYFPEGPLETVREIVGELQTLYSVEEKLYQRDSGNTASVLHLLPQVQCPTLILHARNSAVHPLSEAHKLAAGIPGASLAILETANHIPLPGNSVYDTYMQSLIEFLEAPDEN
ncbi:lysine decarboxylase transcriptional regulator, CadC [Ruegeria halocynthiae]|uniref:Lysine decarboxylase transcriptional regulator, CadC n=1 Tax=Ruegeria halocynthiae TaxID=985054 RepID=A0A1H3CMQ7_9RHOB|nr:winged helix-turn-helix domain-containing protein [Ruegeria halocynthiae]SDX55395.1 lysine decarboxylase transcriptional regulator, CadC [Ruegeria halocynthiae]